MSWNRQLPILVLLCVTAVVLAGCGNKAEKQKEARNTFSDKDSTISTQKLPNDCKRIEQESKLGEKKFPKNIEKICAWSMRADFMAQAGEITVLAQKQGNKEQESPGSIKLRAINTETSVEQWHSKSIALGKPDRNSQREFERLALPESRSISRPAPPLPLLHKDGKTYLALITTVVRPATGVDSQKTISQARFYDLSSKETAEPKTYRAPDEYKLVLPVGEQLLYKKSDDNDDKNYVIVDPSTAEAKDFNHNYQYSTTGLTHNEEVVAATENADVAVTYREGSGENGDRFGVYRADGSPSWKAVDHPAPGASPTSNEFVSIRGQYVILNWRIGEKGSDFRVEQYKRPYQIAVHNARTGEIVATSKTIQPERPSATVVNDLVEKGLIYSSDNRYLTIGSFVFDLKERKALEPLPDALSVKVISTNGIAYTTGNEGRGVTYDLNAHEVISDEPGDSMVQPTVAVENAVLISTLVGSGNSSPPGNYLVAYPVIKAIINTSSSRR